MKELLNCGGCELSSPSGDMCGEVARRAVAKVAQLGYDTSSDTRPYGAIVDHLSVVDSRVATIAEQECNSRLQQRQNEHAASVQ